MELESISNKSEQFSTNPHLTEKRILIIEPMYGGSHQQFIDTVIEGLENITIYLFTLPAKKWHWRARTCALHFVDVVPRDVRFDVVFATSVLNLAEFIALRPDLAQCKKILYFHENQLVYPVQTIKERDFQYGYNQIISSLVADKVVFNSDYNRSSFLNSINKFFKLQPDCRPKNVREKLIHKCDVLYVPIKFPSLRPVQKGEILHIVWPHRWEHDKDPETFFQVLSALKQHKFLFVVSVVGKTSHEQPIVFKQAAEELADNIRVWSYLPSKEEFYRLLQECHVAVSTAKHEFYGISMLEAVSCGCFPLCPDSLVYPEIFPKQCLYENKNGLLDVLKGFCETPNRALEMRNTMQFNLNTFSAEQLIPKYKELFEN